MTAPPPDLDRLAALIAEAKAAAATSDPGLRRVADLLERAFDAVRALKAHDGRPDEGLRPDQLTTDNDR